MDASATRGRCVSPVAIALTVSLSGCSPNALGYSQPIDVIYAALHLNGLFGHRICATQKSIEGREVIASIPDRECYRFARPERMRGVWFLAEETSYFFPDAAVSPRNPYAAGEVWLDGGQEPRRGVFDEAAHGDENAFTVEFIGRRALYPGRYGHMGGSGRLIVIDRLLSAKPTPARSLAATRPSPASAGPAPRP